MKKQTDIWTEIHVMKIKADSYSAGKEILCLLWNLKIHYHIHKSQSLDPILNQLNLVHTLTPYFLHPI